MLSGFSSLEGVSGLLLLGFSSLEGVSELLLLGFFGLWFLGLRLVCCCGGVRGGMVEYFPGGGHRCAGLPVKSNFSNSTAGSGVSISGTGGCLVTGWYIVNNLLVAKSI